MGFRVNHSVPVLYIWLVTYKETITWTQKKQLPFGQKKKKLLILNKLKKKKKTKGYHLEAYLVSP